VPRRRAPRNCDRPPRRQYPRFPGDPLKVTGRAIVAMALGFGAGIDLDAKAKKNEAQEVTLPGLES
jgi:hypothetical protein